MPAPSGIRPAQLPAGMAGVWGAPLPLARGAALAGGAVWAGAFPDLSLSCHRARRLLKNLFRGSSHRRGNDGRCLRQHLSSRGWGTASPLPARSWLRRGARQLISAGMEARAWAWDGSCLPPPALTLAPHPKAGLGR